MATATPADFVFPESDAPLSLTEASIRYLPLNPSRVSSSLVCAVLRWIPILRPTSPPKTVATGLKRNRLTSNQPRRPLRMRPVPRMRLSNLSSLGPPCSADLGWQLMTHLSVCFTTAKVSWPGHLIAFPSWRSLTAISKHHMEGAVVSWIGTKSGVRTQSRRIPADVRGGALCGTPGMRMVTTFQHAVFARRTVQQTT